MPAWEDIRDRLAQFSPAPAQGLQPGLGIPQGALPQDAPDQIEMAPMDVSSGDRSLPAGVQQLSDGLSQYGNAQNIGPLMSGAPPQGSFQRRRVPDLTHPQDLSPDTGGTGAPGTNAPQGQETQAPSSAPVASGAMPAPQTGPVGHPSQSMPMSKATAQLPPEPMPADPVERTQWAARELIRLKGTEAINAQEKSDQNQRDLTERARIIDEDAQRAQAAQDIAEQRNREHQARLDTAITEQHARSQRLQDAAQDPNMLFPDRNMLGRYVSNALLAVSAGMGSRSAAAIMQNQIEQDSKDDELMLKRRDSWLSGLRQGAEAGAQETSSAAQVMSSDASAHAALQAARMNVAAQRLGAAVAKMAPGQAKIDGELAVNLIQQSAVDKSVSYAKDELDMRVKQAQLAKLQQGPGRTALPMQVEMPLPKIEDYGYDPASRARWEADTGNVRNYNANVREHNRMAIVVNQSAGGGFSQVNPKSPTQGVGKQISPPAGKATAGKATAAPGATGGGTPSPTTTVTTKGQAPTQQPTGAPSKAPKLPEGTLDEEAGRLIRKSDEAVVITNPERDNIQRRREEEEGIAYGTERVIYPDGHEEQRTRYLSPPRNSPGPHWEKSEIQKNRKLLADSTDAKTLLGLYAEASAFAAANDDDGARAWLAGHVDMLQKYGIAPQSIKNAQGLRSVLLAKIAHPLTGVINEGERPDWEKVVADIGKNENIDDVKSNSLMLLGMLSSPVKATFQGYDQSPIERDDAKFRERIDGLNRLVQTPAQVAKGQADIKNTEDKVRGEVTQAASRGELNPAPLESSHFIEGKTTPKNDAPVDMRAGYQQIVNYEPEIRRQAAESMRLMQTKDFQGASTAFDRGNRLRDDQRRSSIDMLNRLPEGRTNELFKRYGIKKPSSRRGIWDLTYYQLRPLIDDAIRTDGRSLAPSED